MRRVQHSFLLMASLAAPCAFAQAPVNLALNKPITASSTENPTALKAENANDGDLGTRWGSAFVNPSWITVDLGSEQSIGRVVLRWEGAYATAYTLRVSSDGSTWSTVHSKTNGQGGVEDISFTPVLARYVSMYGTQKNSIYGYSLHEFEVYALGGGTTPDPDPDPEPQPPAPPGTAPTTSFNTRPTGNQTEPAAPFNITEVAPFNGPWGLDFLPDGRIVVTEKSDRMYLVTQAGVKTSISGLPVSVGANGGGGQNGLHDVATSPTFAQDHTLWFSYVARTSDNKSRLTLASARLTESGGTASLSNLTIVWQEPSTYSMSGQPGARIAFAPNGQHIYLAVGDGDVREANGDRGHVAQGTDSALGKIIRLNLDGTTPSDNPEASFGGVRGQVWAKGFRNPYGLAFDGSGNLWLNEMGPASGDEFNFIIKGANYGWPLVNNGNRYAGDPYLPGQPYPRHDTAPQFTAPAAYWGWTSATGSMSPSGMAFYNGNLFPQWKGSALLGGTSSVAIYRAIIDPATNNVTGMERYGRGANNVYTGRVRALKVAADGSIWYLKDGGEGSLNKLTPL